MTQNQTAQLDTAQRKRHTKPLIKAKALAHLIFERPNLDEAERFMIDFDLELGYHEGDSLYLRGTGTTPYCYRVHRADKARFVGVGLTLASRADLQRLTIVPGASRLQAVDTPGGGERMRLTAPSGFLFEAAFDQQSVEALPHRAPLWMSRVDELPRFKATQRPPVKTPEVITLGHVVLEVANYQETCAWHTGYFGLIPSDVHVLPNGSPAVAFMRLNLADAPAANHTLAVAQGFIATYSHSAYELVDVDAVGIGPRVLRQNSWRHSWGIGRQILGSPIFDYWQDSWGDKHEYYRDGDLLTADQPTGIHAVSPEDMSQWGRNMPKSFIKPRSSLGNISALLRNRRRSPDLKMRKLILQTRLLS